MIKEKVDYLNKLSERLAELRKKNGLTLKELSEELDGIKPVTLSRYEHKRREPNIDTLLKIADYFNCSVDYLIGKVEYMNLDELVELNNMDPAIASNARNIHKVIDCYKSSNIKMGELKNTIDFLEKLKNI
ncbi:MAG: helix-turn-helix domain-containing protein [Halarsenatibacteraceae bacterium]